MYVCIYLSIYLSIYLYLSISLSLSASADGRHGQFMNAYTYTIQNLDSSLTVRVDSSLFLVCMHASLSMCIYICLSIYESMNMTIGPTAVFSSRQMSTISPVILASYP